MTYAPYIGWALFAGVAAVPLWKMLTGLVEWEGPGGKLTIGGTTAVTILTFGALAYGIGAGAGGLTGIAKAVGVGSAPAVGAPNVPSITATVYRDQGDSLWIDGGTFAGSGGDTHAQTYIWIDTAGGTFSPPQYHGDTIGAIERDSVGGNLAALDSGAVVDIIMAYEGSSGGWSAPDTLSAVEVVAGDFGTIVFASSWNTATGTTSDAKCDTGATTSWTNCASETEVFSTSGAGRDYPTDNFIRIGDNDGVDVFASSGYFKDLEVDSVRAIRFYFRINNSTSVDDKHPIYMTDATSGGCGQNWGPCVWGLYKELTQPTDFFLLSAGADTNVPGVTDRYYIFLDSAIGADSTVIIETKIHRTGTTSYKMDARIKDLNGTIIRDSTDIIGRDTGDRITSVTFNVDTADRIRLGTSGLRLNCVEGGCPAGYLEFAAVAIADGGWVPPYEAGEAGN